MTTKMSEKISEDDGKVSAENNKRYENAKKKTIKANECRWIKPLKHAPITHLHKK